MGLIGRPYTPRIQAKTIKNLTGKMASFKGKRGLHASEFKNICDSSATIKNNPHLRSMAYNIYKSMKGAAPRDISVKTHHGKQFVKEYGKALKALGKETGIRATKFGRKKIIESPKAAGQRLIEEQIKSEKPAGPTKEELLKQKKRAAIIKTLNIRKAVERRKEEEGEFRLHDTSEKREKDSKTEAPPGQTGQAVPMAGTSIPRDPRAGRSLTPAGEEFTPPQAGDGEETDSQDEVGIFSDEEDASDGQETKRVEDRKNTPINAAKDKKRKREEETGEPDVGGLFDA